MEPEAAPSRERLRLLIERLDAGLIERRRHVRLALLAALAGEHVLLIGPPGTAKSELARRIHRAFAEAAYFERLLTRFSVPEELFGPLSIAALEQDRYERHTAGFLPQATIAFIDEVFKANSAILNALLTLLNEREFDNGARREATPLVSVIGASNELPQDEVLAAFHDRFLVQLHVGSVGAESFAALLALPEARPALEPALQLSRAALAALARAAAGVALPAEIGAALADLRAHLQAHEIYVSDRRWVKIVRLLRTAAATDGRTAVSLWDLWLLQFCAAQQAAHQQAVADWHAQRLGVLAALSPARLTRVVEAFEAQLQLETSASDLNYDASGKLALGEETQDAKGAAHAPRMTFMRQRRYGPTHIGARCAQIDGVLADIDAYRSALAARLAEVDCELAGHLWIDDGFAAHAARVLEDTDASVCALRARLAATRAGFAALPRLPADDGLVPEPVGPTG